MWKILRNAIFATLISALMAMAVNVAHPSGIDWFAKSEYEILVPCPETSGEVLPFEADKLFPAQKGNVLVDSRQKELFSQSSVPESINIPFDYLEPVSEQAVKTLLKKKAKKIIQIGDGENPDSGEQLAKELAGSGIRNVYFVPGGIEKARQALKDR